MSPLVSPNHWTDLPIGGSLDGGYFSPPTHLRAGQPDPVLSVTAFHITLPRAGIVLVRSGLGAPWVRIS